MGHDLKAAADEADVFRRLKAAAVAVVDEYDGMRDQMFLGQKVDALRAVLLEMAPAPVRPATVWDVDPRKHFGRVGGKVAATITEVADGTWEMTTDDGRTWPKFRTPEQARKAFEQPVPARVRKWEFQGGPIAWDLYADGKIVGGITAGRKEGSKLHFCYQIHRMDGNRISLIGTLDSVNEAKAHLLLELDLVDGHQLRRIRELSAVQWEWSATEGHAARTGTRHVGGFTQRTDGKFVGYVTLDHKMVLSLGTQSSVGEAKAKAEEVIFDLACKAVLS